jgi:hypothetical protein
MNTRRARVRLVTSSGSPRKAEATAAAMDANDATGGRSKSGARGTGGTVPSSSWVMRSSTRAHGPRTSRRTSAQRRIRPRPGIADTTVADGIDEHVADRPKQDLDRGARGRLDAMPPTAEQPPMLREHAPKQRLVDPTGHDEMDVIGHQAERERPRKRRLQARPQPPRRLGPTHTTKAATRMRDQMHRDRHARAGRPPRPAVAGRPFFFGRPRPRVARARRRNFAFFVSGAAPSQVAAPELCNHHGSRAARGAGGKRRPATRSAARRSGHSGLPRGRRRPGPWPASR